MGGVGCRGVEFMIIKICINVALRCSTFKTNQKIADVEHVAGTTDQS